MDLFNAAIVETPREFRKWMREASSGRACIYHTGFLLCERLDRFARELRHEALKAHARKKVRLFQKRGDQGPVYSNYDYLAVMR